MTVHKEATSSSAESRIHTTPTPLELNGHESKNECDVAKNYH